MERRIIEISEERCNGCGACAAACHEGAIAMVDGKARLMRDDYCDGLGDCLPACPTGAITFTVREAAPYDQAAVLAKKLAGMKTGTPRPGAGCPGSAARNLGRRTDAAAPDPDSQPSRLSDWPVQLRLAPVHAPHFDGARLLIAADCSAYAYAGFHEKFMKDRTTLIFCPKLDPVDYTEKLTEILRQNHIQDITVVRMVVPCCGGVEKAVRAAIDRSGCTLPLSVFTLSLEGDVMV